MGATKEEQDRTERLENEIAYLNNAFDRLSQIREYLLQVCEKGAVIKGAGAAELLLAVDDARESLDAGLLLARQARAAGTTVCPRSLLA